MTTRADRTLTAAGIAEWVDGRLVGDGSVAFRSMDTLANATEDQLTYIGARKYADQWPASRAPAALVDEGLDLTPGDGRALIFVDNVDLAVATVLERIAEPWPRPPVGAHASAIVDSTAALGKDTRIGPGAVIGPGVTLGDRTVIHAGVILMADSQVGADCVLWPGVVIRERCRLGDRVILHPNVTIGDGALIGGCAAVRDHVTIGAGAKIMGFAGVMTDVPAGESWGGYQAQDALAAARERAACHRLPDMLRTVKRLKRELDRETG